MKKKSRIPKYPKGGEVPGQTGMPTTTPNVTTAPGSAIVPQEIGMNYKNLLNGVQFGDPNAPSNTSNLYQTNPTNRTVDGSIVFNPLEAAYLQQHKGIDLSKYIPSPVTQGPTAQIKRKGGSTIPKYAGGGNSDFWQKTGQIAGNTGIALGDTVLGAVGLSNVINENAYMGPNADKWNTGGDIAGAVGKVALPMALEAAGVPPQATMAAQSAIGGFNPAAPPTAQQVMANKQPTAPGVNNDPMNYFAQGGQTPTNVIEVEGNELEVRDGKITKDFKKQPTHEKGGYQYAAKPDHVIVPSRMRDKYMEADKTTRRTLEKNLVNDQIKREASIDADVQKDFDAASAAFDNGGAYVKRQFKDGGNTSSIHIKPSLKAVFSKAADRVGMTTEEYAHHVLGTKGSLDDIPQMKGGGWIAHAVNPAHKGYCTPMSKPTCTGHRRAFALMMKKKHGFHKAEGGMTTPCYNCGGMTDMVKKFDGGGDPFYPTPDGQLPGGIQNYNGQNMWGSPQTQIPGNNNFATAPGVGDMSQGTNWGQYANMAMQFAPIAYNLARGFQKPVQLDSEKYQNPYEGQVRDLMAKRSVDFTPVENDIRNNYRTAFARAGAGAKSSGQVLSDYTALAGNRADSIARAKLQAQEANMGYRGQEASTLAGLGQNRAGTNLTIQDINARNLAARNNFQAQAATEIGQYGQGANRDQIYNNMLEDMFNNYKYDPATGKYEFKG